MTCLSQLFPVAAERHLCISAMFKSGNKKPFPLLIFNRTFTGSFSRHACNLFQQLFVLIIDSRNTSLEDTSMIIWSNLSRQKHGVYKRSQHFV